MEYLIGAAAGIAAGGTVGLTVYFAFWRRMIKENRADASGKIYARLIIGYALIFVVLALLIAFRNLLPFSYIAAFFGAAAAFGATEFLHPVGRIMEINQSAEDDTEE